MTSSCIERRENKLKNAVKKAQKAQKESEEKLQKTQKVEKESEEKVTKIKQDTKNILTEIVNNIDENGKLNPKTLQKILTITSKILIESSKSIWTTNQDLINLFVIWLLFDS